jgi:hypothetical protein
LATRSIQKERTNQQGNPKLRVEKQSRVKVQEGKSTPPVYTVHFRKCFLSIRSSVNKLVRLYAQLNLIKASATMVLNWTTAIVRLNMASKKSVHWPKHVVYDRWHRTYRGVEMMPHETSKTPSRMNHQSSSTSKLQMSTLETPSGDTNLLPR